MYKREFCYPIGRGISDRTGCNSFDSELNINEVGLFPVNLPLIRVFNLEG